MNSPTTRRRLSRTARPPPEKLFGVKSLDKAIEVSRYAKTAYEGFVAEASKLSELYSDLAKETYKPFEGMFAKVNPTK